VTVKELIANYGVWSPRAQKQLEQTVAIRPYNEKECKAAQADDNVFFNLSQF